MIAVRPASLSAAFVLALALAAPADAQQPPPARQPAAPPQAPAQAKSPAAPRDTGAADAGLRQRVEQLEEQLVDMQVVIGTLESLARGVTAPSAPGARQAPGPGAAIGAADAGRLDGIETQIGALTAQLEQLQEQLRALAARVDGGRPAPQAATEPPGPPRTPQTERAGFGSVTVSPDGKRDDIDRILSGSPPAQRGPQVAAAPSAPGPAEADTASPKQLYETAYGYLLQRDYGAAEAAFDEFLRRHPNDPLAGNAQYWLGESLYVRGQYRAAAGAFLKGYQNYGRSPKAPESLLKLAMSLQRLGQKDAACSSYNELSTKFPGAPAHVKTTAQAERQKAGC